MRERTLQERERALCVRRRERDNSFQIEVNGYFALKLITNFFRALLMSLMALYILTFRVLTPLTATPMQN